eukprot:CAMPEP_0178960678 /NCGR_PEP_ID=MMETSP0789-20121207/13113_1 /TAXON_ID=3005 /ORGANISM="Rhizosolenia setigera, Strain CCMP 1694" /LENGTH=575 /DNA_ID=CAMNT_0020644085 /DNA_START=71 /DNA_END=1798 /DNA_ORIENTATION=+
MSDPRNDISVGVLQMIMTFLMAIVADEFGNTSGMNEDHGNSSALFVDMIMRSNIVLQRKIKQISYQEAVTLTTISILVSLSFILSTKNKIKLLKMNMPIIQPSHFIPFIGSVPDFISNVPWDLMQRWHSQYGPIYQFTLFGRNCVAIASPKLLKVVLQSKIQNVKKDVKFAYKPFLCILGKGIVTAEGKSWMKQRLKMSAALRIDVLDDIPRITLGAVQRLCRDKLDVCAKENKSIEIGEELRHLTLQVIAETFFSLDPKECNETFAEMYLPLVEEGNKRVWHPERSFGFFLPFFWQHLAAERRLNNYVSKLIRDRILLRKEEKSVCKRHKDILDRMLDHYEKHWIGNPKYMYDNNFIKQLRDELKTFMLAGHETSAAMMTWAIYELVHHQDLMDMMSTEAKSVFGETFDWCLDEVNEKNLPDRVDELSKLCLSEACLKESLRKYSVVPTVSRMMVKDTQVGPHFIPKGASIFISIQGVHHDPNIWPDPSKFNPFRFTSSPSKNSSTSTDVNPPPKIEPYTFIPFIEGPRNCLGQYLALLESKMVLALIFQRYNLTLCGSSQKINDEVKVQNIPT